MFPKEPQSYEMEKQSGLRKPLTPLVSAAKKKHLDKLGILLANGADPLIKDSWEQTTMELAHHHGFKALVARLRQLSTLPSDPHHNGTEGDRFGDT